MWSSLQSQRLFLQFKALYSSKIDMKLLQYHEFHLKEFGTKLLDNGFEKYRKRHFRDLRTFRAFFKCLQS